MYFIRLLKIIIQLSILLWIPQISFAQILKQDDTASILSRLVMDVCIERTRSIDNLQIQNFKKVIAANDSRLETFGETEFWMSDHEKILIANETVLALDQEKYTCVVYSGIYGFEFDESINMLEVLNEIKDWGDLNKSNNTYIDFQAESSLGEDFLSYMFDNRFNTDELNNTKYRCMIMMDTMVKKFTLFVNCY